MMDIITKEEIISFPGINLRINVVKNFEELCTEPDNEEKIPYWADIWPAARVMARVIWNDIDFHGYDVLELGAGLGLPGITAALKGGAITFSDFEEEALKISVANAALNGINNVKTYLGDWRDFRLKKKYDWILASDILYSSKNNPFAEKVFENNLKKDGVIIIAHADRKATYLSVNRLSQKKFIETERRVESITLHGPYYPNYKITIHYLQKIV